MCERFAAKPSSELANSWLQNRHWKGDGLGESSLSEISLSLLLVMFLTVVDVSLMSIFFSTFVSNVSREIGGSDATRRLILYTLF